MFKGENNSPSSNKLMQKVCRAKVSSAETFWKLFISQKLPLNMQHLALMKKILKR